MTHVVLEEPADFPISSRYKGCQERCWGDIVEGHGDGASPRALKNTGFWTQRNPRDLDGNGILRALVPTAVLCQGVGLTPLVSRRDGLIVASHMSFLRPPAEGVLFPRKL